MKQGFSWRAWFGKEHGHGLAEYCLVTAFIALIALALYIHASGGMQDLWSTANSTLVTGSASTGAGGSSTTVSTH